MATIDTGAVRDYLLEYTDVEARSRLGTVTSDDISNFLEEHEQLCGVLDIDSQIEYGLVKERIGTDSLKSNLKDLTEEARGILLDSCASTFVKICNKYAERNNFTFKDSLMEIAKSDLNGSINERGIIYLDHHMNEIKDMSRDYGFAVADLQINYNNR